MKKVLEELSISEIALFLHSSGDDHQYIRFIEESCFHKTLKPNDTNLTAMQISFRNIGEIHSAAGYWLRKCGSPLDPYSWINVRAPLSAQNIKIVCENFNEQVTNFHCWMLDCAQSSDIIESFLSKSDALSNRTHENKYLKAFRNLQQWLLDEDEYRYSEPFGALLSHCNLANIHGILKNSQDSYLLDKSEISSFSIIFRMSTVTFKDPITSTILRSLSDVDFWKVVYILNLLKFRELKVDSKNCVNLELLRRLRKNDNFQSALASYCDTFDENNSWLLGYEISKTFFKLGNFNGAIRKLHELLCIDNADRFKVRFLLDCSNC